jgi:hypothetical protein
MKSITKSEKASIYKSIMEDNITDAARGLLGFEVKNAKIRIPDDARKKLVEKLPHTTTFRCGCVGCMELSKIFIDNSRDLKEHIIGVSMQDADVKITKLIG